MGHVAAEEPGSGYVVDPEIEKIIAAAIDPDKAVAFSAQKRLVELGGAAERALNHKLFSEKTTPNRRTYADLIARCCAGRVGYRVTLELLPDGSGRLVLESDRTVLAECAQKYDRLNNKPQVVFPPDELRRNPYSKVDLAKHIVGSMKYNQGGTLDNNGRIVASGEVGFSTFDDFAAFATSFDKLGYHMLNGISIFDNNNLRTLRFKKNPENDRNRALTYLLMFHDVKWEFVLDFKGEIKNQNSARADGGKFVWQFNCAQMLSGETEIEASFDPFAVAKQSKDAPRTDDAAVQNPPAPAASGTLAAVPASKVIRVAIGKRYDRATMPNPNGPDTIALLDGNPSQPKGSGLHYQWVQTSGIPLDLPADKLTQPAIKMLFYEGGKYTFDLTVSLNGQVSPPTEVTVLVGDVPLNNGVAQENAADNAQGDPNAERKPIELAPKKKLETANSDPRPQNPAPVEEKPVSKFVATPATIPQPEYKPEVRTETRPTPAPGRTVIALDDIRREEAEYNQRVAARNGISQNTPTPQPKNDPAAVANQNPQGVLNTPPVPPVPQKPEIPQGTLVSKAAAGGIELDEIRREEEQFNRAHPEKLAHPVPFKPVPPQNVPAPIAKPIEKDKPPVVAQPASKPPVAPKPPETPPAVASNDKPDTRLDIPQPTPKDKPKVKAVTPEAPKSNVAPKVTDNTPKPEANPPKISDKELEDIKNKLNSIDNSKVTAKVQPAPTPPAPAVKKDDVKLPEKVVKETPAAVPSIPPGNGGEALKRGLQLLKAGQYTAAAETLKPSALANPKDENTQMALAMALFEGAEKPDGFDRAGTQAALDKFNDVIGLNEGNAQAFMFIGHCNARLEHDQEKGMYYKKGYSLGKDKVAWEIKWALGNRYLKGSEFASAADVLVIAETAAIQAGVNDPRLLRDLAIAFHGSSKNDEAIKRVNALWELGYLPDQKLVAELKKVSPAAVKIPDSAYAASAVAPAVAQTPNTPATPTIVKPPESVVKNVDPNTVPKPQPTPAATPGTDVKPVANVNVTPPKPKTIEDLDKMAPSIVKPSPRPNPAVQKPESPKESPRVAKPLPPVPATFEAALAAGKRAVARGNALLEENSERTKNEIQDCWDEAEAMLRGAWTLKPDDLEVKAQFEELAKQVGVIALVKSPVLISKPNGLVVLNAEPSIVFPEGKVMYYAWQQVDGKELNIRHEDLDKKMVGLRIKNPGTYKFELVVSDGTRGGNPVTVVVEVR